MKGRKKPPVKGRNTPRRKLKGKLDVGVSSTTFSLLDPKRIKAARLDGETLAELLNLKALHPAVRLGVLKALAYSLREQGLTVTWRVQGMEAFTLSQEEELFDVSAA